jgi:hypothetical protein
MLPSQLPFATRGFFARKIPEILLRKTPALTSQRLLRRGKKYRDIPEYIPPSSFVVFAPLLLNPPFQLVTVGTITKLLAQLFPSNQRNAGCTQTETFLFPNNADCVGNLPQKIGIVVIGGFENSVFSLLRHLPEKGKRILRQAAKDWQIGEIWRSNHLQKLQILHQFGAIALLEDHVFKKERIPVSERHGVSILRRAIRGKLR